MREAIVRIDANHDWQVLASVREAVRLGEGEFTHSKITRPAMERGLLVLKKFADIARRYDVSEIDVVATAALREALNRSEFVDRALEEAGVDVRVVPGVEEARLIYLGVSSSVELSGQRGLFIDIGGGTTEVIVGDNKDYQLLDSLKLGAIRLADIHQRSVNGPINKKQYRKLVEYAQGIATHAVRKIRDIGFDVVYGSSGTITNLAEITARRVDPSITSIRNYYMKYTDLAETISILCSLSLEQRRSVPGINPDRADIIVSGAAILDAILTDVRADGIRISDRALREGMVIDHLFQEDLVREKYQNTSVRERSILQLAKQCHFEEAHGRKVSDLACSIFSQLSSLKLHSYGEAEEELLRYASLAHDLGTFLSYTDHHKHSYYLLRNWNLLGFDDEEIEIIASTALCHRKMSPRKLDTRKLTVASRNLVEVLSSIVRVADALDRTQMGLVREVICRYKPSDKKIVMEIYASEDCPLEMWALESKKTLFEKTFGAGLMIKRIVTS